MATRKQIARSVDSRLVAAARAGRQRRCDGDLAVSVDYDPRSKRLHIELTSGAAISVPVAKIQGLADIGRSKIKSVRIDANGYGLHWPELDLDISVPDLIAGCFGSRAWMTAMGRNGGKSTSAAKANAARENGKKGGRPPAKAIPPPARRLVARRDS